MKMITFYLFLLITPLLYAADTDEEVPPYRIRYGDRFNLSLYEEPQTEADAVVGPDGKIHYLFSTSTLAIGKTISEVREELSNALKDYFKHPLLSIQPASFVPHFYTVIGEVNSPGVKELFDDSTVLSALCEAQGFTTRLFRNQTVENVDLDHSFLARNGKFVPIAFESLLKEGNMDWNIPLKEGDYLFFANSETLKIFVVGEVIRPTVVDYLSRMTLLQALSDAGGVTARASSRVIVIRGSLVYPRWFYIDRNLIGKGKACDFELMPKDIVYVPPMQFQTLKEIVQEGIMSFVSIAANVGGSNSFFAVTPAAIGTNTISPVPVVGGGVAGVTTAATDAATPAAAPAASVPGGP